MTKQEAINIACRIWNDCACSFPNAFSEVVNWMNRHYDILNQINNYKEYRTRLDGEMFCWGWDDTFYFVEKGWWDDDEGDYVYRGYEIYVCKDYFSIYRHCDNGVVETLRFHRERGQRYDNTAVYHGQFSLEDSDRHTLENTNYYFWRIDTACRPKFRDARIERSGNIIYQIYWDNHREEYVRI